MLIVLMSTTTGVKNASLKPMMVFNTDVVFCLSFHTNMYLVKLSRHCQRAGCSELAHAFNLRT